MARRIPRASLPGADGDPAVPGGVQDRRTESGDVVLRLLHTADWHLGRRFSSFPDEGQKKLSRARMDVISRILDVARRNAVNAGCALEIYSTMRTRLRTFGKGLQGRSETMLVSIRLSF
jgi:hypothetical protein